MAKQILLLRMSSEGYSVWREDDLEVAARFSTMRRARSYLRRLGRTEEAEPDGDRLDLENAIYQIVQLDLDQLELDPQPEQG